MKKKEHKPKQKIKRSVRLPSHISPVRYRLTLKPDLEAFTFSGEEAIEIVLSKPTKTLTIHSKDLDIQSAEVVVGKSKYFATKTTYNPDAETVTFVFPQTIKKGKAALHLGFVGVINDSLRGFYKSTYEIDGVTKHIATTQFEATDARRAFPCFDEPAHKAIFNVKLIVPGSHTAISNTLPISTEEHKAGYKVVTFAPTPRMSTYLLAFIIGEFEYVEGYTKNKTQVRVFTTEGKSHQAKFALDVAIRCLDFYNEYFAIPYPLPILDMIAIPDFESGAMENWGAVTYRETALLVDEQNTSLSNKQWIATVVAHELAHQWFGNLVTMRWWTDLWLNEGFADFIQNVALDHIFPEWHIWELWLGDARQATAMKLDSLANSHPIQVEVHHPSEISEIFDMISYAKGSAILRQLQSYVGEDAFRDGLRHYLKKHSYKNTETTHLWESLEKVSKLPVGNVMKSWTMKMGYPLVTLEKKKDTFTVSQERFLSSRLEVSAYKKAKNKTPKTIWAIPLSYESNSEQMKMLLTKQSAPLVGTSIGKLNLGETSFMRVRYDTDTLTQLREQVEKGSMHVADRLGIIRDLFAMAEAGYIPTDEALEFSLVYKNETEYIVWSEIALGVNKIYNIIPEGETKEKYKRYALSLFSPLAEHMGWEHKSGMQSKHGDVFLRSLALAQAGAYGDNKVITSARRLFKARAKSPIRADIRSVVYSIVAQNGGIKEWEELKKSYDKEQMHEEKDRYARALTQFRDQTLIARTLVFALSTQVRDQDAPHLLAAVWQNSRGRALAWAFVKHHWPTILARYGEGNQLSRIVSPLGAHTDTKDMTDAKKFFRDNRAPGAARTLEQSYERIASNAAWQKADSKLIKKWLDKNF
jgi:puromycin-sensitive aminopeptidase